MPPILLLRPDRAGDALKTLPVLRSLKDKRPSIEVHLLASEHNASVFAHEPGIHLHVLPKNWKKMKADTLRSALGADFPKHFGQSVNLLCDASEDAELLLSAISADSTYSCSLADPAGELARRVARLRLPESTPAGRDESENIALLLSQVVGVDLSRELYKFGTGPILSENDRNEALEKMGTKRGRWLGFCPFAGNTHRTHPLKKWERFVSRITREESFEKFFLFGTPSDYARLERLHEVSERKDSVELCFPSSFRTLGAYLKRLDGVVAVDSGPLHLARSLGVRSLGILSGGDVRRWFPRNNEGDMLLRRGILQRFPSVIEMVWAFEKWNPASPVAQTGA